ncbi:uncharacterized protein LOC131229076 [Magnolia sinica]|uniref:uncharacterized protein LOC131229076 n=1 Tax=Magnolia sinica TaxID=86752 RepID=UPI0026599FEB|nr:uncharacterized protein LOC131229076 [Magnolia sinica]
MLLAIRLARLQLHPRVRSPFQRSACRETAYVKVRSKSSQQGNREEEMENNKKEHPDNGDVMSQSFGEGYSTRSDEEGFGGVYGGNQAFRKREEGEDIHEKHPEYDKSQGSEVKEKEKGRHQPQKMAKS